MQVNTKKKKKIRKVVTRFLIRVSVFHVSIPLKKALVDKPEGIKIQICHTQSKFAKCDELYLT